MYDTIPSAFLDLNAGRIQGILLDETYADYYIKHEADSSSYQVIINKGVPEDLFAVGMRKGDKTFYKEYKDSEAFKYGTRKAVCGIIANRDYTQIG